MKKVSGNSFFKSIITLASGTLIAQLVSFLASPIMTRIYTPEEIGIYTILITAVSMFGGVITGRYDMSIVYEEDEANVFSLIKLSIIVSLLFSFVVSILYSLYYYNNSGINISYVFVFLTIFILLFLTGISNILISYNNRHKEYKLMSSVGIYQSIGREISMILLGSLKLSVIGLALSQLLGKILGVGRQSQSLRPNIRKIKKVSKEEVYLVAKKHIRQPLFSVPAIFANSFSYSSINLFVSMLYGTSILGFYSISYRILGLPLALVSNNVSKVYFEEATKEFRENKSYNKTFIKTTLFLVSISIPMVLVLIFLAPKMFSWFYGEEWKVAGKYVQILAPMFGVRLIVSPLTTGMLISNKQNYELMIQGAFIIISMIIFFITKFNNLSIEIYLLMLSIFFICIYIVYYIILYKLSLREY